VVQQIDVEAVVPHTGNGLNSLRKRNLILCVNSGNRRDAMIVRITPGRAELQRQRSGRLTERH
jgi:hypothetical protein